MRTHFVRKSVCAFTLIELFIAIAVLILLAAVLLPPMRGNKVHASQSNCIYNLKQVGLAFRTWALDHNDNYPMNVCVTNGGTLEFVPGGLAYVHFQALSNELSTPRILVCPADSKRIRATNFTSDFSNQKLSYFVGLEVVQSNFNAFPSGDRNITNASGIRAHVLTLTTNELFGWTSQLHVGRGNVCLADGSVQGLSINGLRAQLRATGVATNRLAMP
jgi:prepilin-type processing-associated H-X9-DG protein